MKANKHTTKNEKEKKTNKKHKDWLYFADMNSILCFQNIKMIGASEFQVSQFLRITPNSTEIIYRELTLM